MPKGHTSIPARADTIVELLTGREEALSIEQLHAFFPISRSAFDKSLILARNQHRVYIDSFDPPRGLNGAGTWIAKFRAGNQPDALPPKQTKEQADARRRAAAKAFRQRAKEAAPAEKKPRRNATGRQYAAPALDPVSAALFGRAA